MISSQTSKILLAVSIMVMQERMAMINLLIFVFGLEAVYSKRDDRLGGFTHRFSKRASIFLEQELQKRRLLTVK
jgi:hypothetical protein